MKDSVNWAEGWSFGIHSPVWWGESHPTTLIRCVKQGRCAWLVSGLQPRRNRPPNQSCRPSAAGHKMQMCHSDTDPQSHEIIPIIDGRDLLIAIVAWRGTGRCDRWGQSPDWIRDKLILASTVTLYVNPFVSLCSNVGITSLPTPSGRLSVFECAHVSEMRCLQMLYQSAAQRAIQCPERCNKRTIYCNKDTSILEAMLGANVNRNPPMSWH